MSASPAAPDASLRRSEPTLRATSGLVQRSIIRSDRRRGQQLWGRLRRKKVRRSSWSWTSTSVSGAVLV